MYEWGHAMVYVTQMEFRRRGSKRATQYVQRCRYTYIHTYIRTTLYVCVGIVHFSRDLCALIFQKLVLPTHPTSCTHIYLLMARSCISCLLLPVYHCVHIAEYVVHAVVCVYPNPFGQPTIRKIKCGEKIVTLLHLW